MRSSSQMKGYLLAILAPASVAVGRYWFDLTFGAGKGTLLPFVVPVALAAWYGGARAGLLATGFTALIVVSLFSGPSHGLELDNYSDLSRFGFLVCVGIFVSYICEQLIWAREQVQTQADRAESNNRQLLIETAGRLESDRKFRLLLEGVPQLVWTCQPDGYCDYLSRQWVEYTGVPEAEQLGYRWLDVVHPDDRSNLMAAWEKAVREGTPFDVEFRIRSRQGKYRWFKTRAVLFQQEDGEKKWFGTNTDIHDQRVAEEQLREVNATLERRVEERTAALQESERRFRAIFNAQFQFIGLMTLEGLLLEANRTALVAAGISEEQVVGKPFWETPWWTHDQAQQERLKLAIRRAAAGEQDRFEASHVAADGSLIWVDFLLTPFFENGQVVMLIPEGHDITGRKRHEQVMAANEALLTQFIRHSPAAIAMFDRKMRYLRASDRWLADYNLTDQNVIGRSHYEVFPDIPERWKESNERTLAGSVEGCEEDPFHRLDGSIEWVQWKSQPWRDTEGDIGGIIIFAQMITERKRAEAARRASEFRYQLTLEGAGLGTWEWELSTGRVLYDARLTELLGYRQDEFRPVLEEWTSRIHPEDYDRVMSAVNAHLEGHTQSYASEHRLRHRDGHWVWVLAAGAVSERDPEGRPVLMCGIYKNITERKTAEARVQASLREKDVLLKEVHHRVKNNLQIVSALLDLQSEHTRDPAVVQMFQESRGRVKSMAMIHERLYRSQNMARVNFADYVRQLANDLYRTYKVSDDDIRLDLLVDVPPLSLDVAIPCGLLLNELISNCLKHAFKSGRAGCIRVSISQEDDDAVLTVEDDGVGFPADFDIRNTTSFGLQLVSTLVDQLDGELHLITSPRTSISIRFPHNTL